MSEVECYCGALIHEVGDDDKGLVWLDAKGGSLCYPGEAGADGAACHEPIDGSEVSTQT